MKEFGKEYIKYRRLELGLSLCELSKLTGINESSLCKLEIGVINKLSLAKMIKIASTLGIDLFKLIDLDEDMLVITKYFYDVFKNNELKAKVYE